MSSTSLWHSLITSKFRIPSLRSSGRTREIPGRSNFEFFDSVIGRLVDALFSSVGRKLLKFQNAEVLQIVSLLSQRDFRELTGVYTVALGLVKVAIEVEFRALVLQQPEGQLHECSMYIIRRVRKDKMGLPHLQCLRFLRWCGSPAWTSWGKEKSLSVILLPIILSTFSALAGPASVEHNYFYKFSMEFVLQNATAEKPLLELNWDIKGDFESFIQLWEPASGSTWGVDSTPFRGHSASVEDLQWRPTEFVDGNVAIWDVEQK
ncbi:hypothetical protein SAY87_005636 [Trapa incisa]|uniref:Uncharacterized protein n=1 Tax=Trapa incisa TaxID=236973 RepID=A0AAN7Q7G7_9MYRT|nr:hypothetical protein SAY87_005636 [Trapa incisa]